MSEIRIGHWTKFGAAIRDARRSRSLSQAYLAERAGVSRSWLARLEAGHRGAEFEQILRVLSALDLTLSLRDDRSTSSKTTTQSDRAMADAEQDGWIQDTAPARTASSKSSRADASRLRKSRATTGRTGGDGTGRIRLTDSQIPAAAASRILARHQAALGNRRTTWDGASLKVDRPSSG